MKRQYSIFTLINLHRGWAKIKERERAVRICDACARDRGSQLSCLAAEETHYVR